MVSLLGPAYISEEGLCLPHYPGIEENLRRVKEFIPVDNDYVLCSYPKSGSHWVNEILRMLITKSLTYTSHPLNNLESGNVTHNSTDSPRVIHSHLPYHMLPERIQNRKLVYVIRHPKDQIVSLYYHHQGLKWTRKLSFEEFLEKSLLHPDQVEYGNWFQNAYKWWLEARHREDILLLHYEDMKMDPELHVKRIAQFYNLAVTDDFISQVTQKTQFTEMKTKKPIGDWFKEWHKESFTIYRRGITGGWKNHFTDDMNYKFSEFSKRYSALSGEIIPYGGLILSSNIKRPIGDLSPVMPTVGSDSDRHRCLLEKVY